MPLITVGSNPFLISSRFDLQRTKWDVTDISHPSIQRVVDAAARKGVELDIHLLARPAHGFDETAEVLGANAGQVVKSVVIVAVRPGGRLAPLVCLVSGRDSVDPALLSAVSGEVSVRSATADEARLLTGYSIAGMPPFGYGREVRILMDQDLCAHEWLWAAAGTASAMMRVSPRTLRMLGNAIIASLAVESLGPGAKSCRNRVMVPIQTVTGARTARATQVERSPRVGNSGRVNGTRPLALQ